MTIKGAISAIAVAASLGGGGVAITAKIIERHEIARCWDNGDGTACRNGVFVRLEGPGLPSDTVECEPLSGAVEVPCVVEGAP